MGGRGARSGLEFRSNSSIEAAQKGYVRSLLDEGEISTRLSIQKQNKHVLGTKEFKRYIDSRRSGKRNPQSIIYLNYSEIRELINKYAGTAPEEDTEISDGGVVEFFTADKIVGQYFDDIDGVYKETTRFGIYYAKGNAHVVPVWPKRSERKRRE